MTESRYAKVVAGSIFLFVLLIRAPLLDIPFERDEGEYAYVAWRLDSGELPYLDWFDQKPPAIFWIYRLALALPESDLVSVHLMAALFAAATAVALFFLTRSLVGTGGGVAAALVLGFLSADPTLQGTAANTELFMLLPSVCAAWLFVRAVRAREPPAWQYLLIGLLTGAASAFKQVAAINWIFFVATAPLLLTGERRAVRTVSLALWSAAGGLLVWSAIAAHFLAHGGLGAMIDAVFVHNLEYVGALPLEVRLQLLSSTLAGLLVSQLAVWLLAAAGVVLAWMRQRWIAVFLLGWLIASQIGTSAGGHYFPHYFQQLVPALAVACGVAVAEIARRAAGRIPSPLTIGMLTVVMVGPPAGVLASFWAEPTPEDVVRRVYPGNSFDVMPQVAQVVEELTEPGDEVFVFGSEPEVLFHARRRSASRYIFLFPVYGPYREAGKRQQEVIRELMYSEPKVVLLMPNALFFSEGTDQTLTRWVMALLSRRYEPHTLIWLDDDGRRRVVPRSEESSTQGLKQQLGAVLVRRPGG